MMRRLAPEFIEQVRLANDLVEVISEDTFLKQCGPDNYMGLCPFPSHPEKTPSFSVSPSSQLYHCFGCGESGNLYTYLQVKKGLHFMEAVNELAERAGISFSKSSAMSMDFNYLKRKEFLKVNRLASDFYRQKLHNLSDQHSVKKYLKSRGLLKDTVEQFGLGYASSTWDELASHLKKNGVLKRALRLGLVVEKNGRVYDLFRHRVIFPIFSLNGRDVLGFGARSLEDLQPKYINSADSDIFQKGQIFYGWQKSGSWIRSQQKVVIVEGYMDYLSLYQAGFKNVVATLGTALTSHHAKWLSRYVRSVILCFDEDLAGRKATERSLNGLLCFDLVPKILSLGEGKDPDSFIQKHGLNVFHKKVHQAKDLFLTMLSNQLAQTSNHFGDRSILLDKVAILLAGIKNQSLKNYYTRRVLDLFGFDDQWAKSILNKKIKEQQNSLRKKEVQTFQTLDQKKQPDSIPAQLKKISISDSSVAESSLLVLALEDLSNYLKIKNSQVIEQIVHPGIREVFDRLKFYYKTENDSHFKLIIDHLSSEVKEPSRLRKSYYPFLAHLSPLKQKNLIQDCIQVVKRERQKQILKENVAQVHLNEGHNKNCKKYLKKVHQTAKSSLINKGKLRGIRFVK